jgi:phosphoribosylformimino-5-aminoimidazole carboxamide ribotide isomerase
MIVYPALDLRDGGVVRLEQGDYARETRYDRDPVAIADEYAAAGAAWLHLVDLEAARLGRFLEHDTLARLATCTRLHVQVGGGVRAEGDVEALLAAGAARVVVGSTAVRQPALVAGWIARFGAEKVCIALDTRADGDGRLTLPVGGWQEATPFTLFELLEHFAAAGARHVLCTDIARDGLMGGPNVALYAQLKARFPGIDVQASGGARDASDVRALAATGVAGVVVGRALLSGRTQLSDLLQASGAVPC